MAKSTSLPSTWSYIRFDILQRIQHVSLLVSFTTLGLTGLIQKYAQSPISQAILSALGGIEATRLIHHIAAIVMLLVSVAHILDVAYRLFVLRVPWTMLPWIDDLKHVYQDVMYYFGLRKHKAYYGRYSYAEKAEYLALVWGTVVMAITGFMMWNPLATVRYLPGEAIPAAKAAHGGEALLAVLAIIIWHFYHVHIRHFNKSMFHGKMSETEMEHEHPAELAQIQTGQIRPLPFPAELRKRQMIFAPVAAVFTLVMLFGVFEFVFVEKTAITTVPQAETAQVFVPVTPTPRATPTAAPTPTPGAGIGANTWDGAYSALFRNRCGTCHGVTKVGGLSLATYQGALKGGNSGPALIPGDPDNSILVQIQSSGSHPGQLTIDELKQVIAWLMSGAPEK